MLGQHVVLRLGGQPVAELTLRLEDASVLVVVEFINGRLGTREAVLVGRFIEDLPRGSLLLGRLGRLVVVPEAAEQRAQRHHVGVCRGTVLDAGRNALGPLGIQVSHIRRVGFEVLEGLPTGPNGSVAVPRGRVGADGVREALVLCVGQRGRTANDEEGDETEHVHSF